MKNKNILDIGTGSGIIPIICKKEYPESNLFSIDQSKEAIEVAKKNANLQNVLINFECNKIENCGLDKIDFVISNPPYIKEEKLISLQKEVLKEPISAMFLPVKSNIIFSLCLCRCGGICCCSNGLAVNGAINAAHHAAQRLTSPDFPNLIHALAGHPHHRFTPAHGSCDLLHQ